MSQFFYLPPVVRSIVAALEKAGFSYYGIEDEWDETALTCCGFRISIDMARCGEDTSPLYRDDAWGADEWGDDIRYLRAIWEESADVWEAVAVRFPHRFMRREIELSLIDHQERANIAIEKVINLIQSATLKHRTSEGQLCLFKEEV